jgi:polysaccharide pyruvyl transferase WcaK-like protein
VLYLIGVPGHPNYGEELTARAWLRELAQRAPNEHVWLDCPNPGNAQVLLDGIHPGLRCTDTLWHLCWDAPGEDAASAVDYVRRALDDRSLSPRFSAGVELLLRAESVHLIGGGFINDKWPRHLALLGALAELSARGTRTYVTGQGFLPVADEAVLRDLLKGLSLVEVRDEASAQLLKGVAELGTADAWLDPAATSTPASRELAEQLDVVLCLQTDQHDQDVDALAAQVRRQLEHWQVDPARVALVECLPGGDRPVYDVLLPDLPGLRFVPWIDVWKDGLPVAAHQKWITTRFHPHLLAGAAGAWGTAIAVDPVYYRTKHDSLISLGSDWAVVQPGADPVDAPSSWRGLSYPARRLPAAKSGLAERIYGAPPQPESTTPFKGLARFRQKS